MLAITDLNDRSSWKLPIRAKLAHVTANVADIRRLSLVCEERAGRRRRRRERERERERHFAECECEKNVNLIRKASKGSGSFLRKKEVGELLSFARLFLRHREFQAPSNIRYIAQ